MAFWLKFGSCLGQDFVLCVVWAQSHHMRSHGPSSAYSLFFLSFQLLSLLGSTLCHFRPSSVLMSFRPHSTRAQGTVFLCSFFLWFLHYCGRSCPPGLQYQVLPVSGRDLWAQMVHASLARESGHRRGPLCARHPTASVHQNCVAGSCHLFSYDSENANGTYSFFSTF